MTEEILFNVWAEVEGQIVDVESGEELTEWVSIDRTTKLLSNADAMSALNYMHFNSDWPDDKEVRPTTGNAEAMNDSVRESEDDARINTGANLFPVLSDSGIGVMDLSTGAMVYERPQEVWRKNPGCASLILDYLVLSQSDPALFLEYVGKQKGDNNA